MKETAEFFNICAAEWDNRERSTPEQLRHIIECANVSRGDNVLDVGTGTGILLPYIANAVGTFGRIDAIDFSKDMLDCAHKKHAKLPLPVSFILSDIENDPVHNLYDRIILFNVLPHLRHPFETIVRLFSCNLTGAGSITIAHANSRDKVNEQHAKLDVPTLDLPPASAFAARLVDAGINVDYVEDSPYYYILRMRRH